MSGSAPALGTAHRMYSGWQHTLLSQHRTHQGAWPERKLNLLYRCMGSIACPMFSPPRLSSSNRLCWRQRALKDGPVSRERDCTEQTPARSPRVQRDNQDGETRMN